MNNTSSSKGYEEFSAEWFEFGPESSESGEYTDEESSEDCCDSLAVKNEIFNEGKKRGLSFIYYDIKQSINFFIYSPLSY